MLVVTLFHLQENIPKDGVDIIEIRVDQCNQPRERIIQFIQENDKPVLLTYRKGTTNSLEYFKMLHEMADYDPVYLDIEFDTPKRVIDAIRKKVPRTKIILSYHAEKFPRDLNKIYSSMKRKGSDYYKIVINAESGLDGLKILHFLKRVQDRKLSAFCMGTKGAFTRILSKTLGSALHYCSLEKFPPYGQFSFAYLQKIYRFSQLNEKTEIYGLIGSPIDKSLSDITHNEVFCQMNHNACYVKIDLTEKEIKKGLSLLKSLSFKGVSVTMPLKGAFNGKVRFADPIAKRFQKINTLVFDQQVRGYNTDAIALQRILDKYLIRSAKVLILGSGAIAQILSYLLCQRDCLLIYYHRSYTKLKPLLDLYQGNLFDPNQNYDVLINTTPVGMDGVSLPLPVSWIKPHKKVFDVITYPKWTPLLKASREKECEVIFGEEMFALQAAGQFSLWKDIFTFS